MTACAICHALTFESHSCFCCSLNRFQAFLVALLFGVTLCFSGCLRTLTGLQWTQLLTLYVALNVSQLTQVWMSIFWLRARPKFRISPSIQAQVSLILLISNWACDATFLSHELKAAEFCLNLESLSDLYRATNILNSKMPF